MRRTFVLLAFPLALACARGELERGARTTLTSGDPKPEASPRSTRTIDNTGFVDNGGRTSDMWGRPETSGARATEAGGDRPTGTTSGVPNGADLGGRGKAERTRPRPSDPDVVELLSRARCDHETTCTRVGDGRTWPSQDACMADFRARAGAELGSCTLDRAAVETCLASIRTQSCTPALERDPLSVCLATAMCAP